MVFSKNSHYQRIKNKKKKKKLIRWKKFHGFNIINEAAVFEGDD